MRNPDLPPLDPSTRVSQWWRTAITELEPGQIRLRGYPIEEVITRLSFVQTVWLMIRGELPSRAQVRLLECALVACVDHGPLSPSSAIVRMAMTCGVGLNGALSAAIGVLGDNHGGAGQQCMLLLYGLQSRISAGQTLSEVVEQEIQWRFAAGEPLPGFGKHQHPVDPRATALIACVREAVSEGAITGQYLALALGLEAELAAVKGRHIPMNIDGVLALTLAELGFEVSLGRGFFILGRLVGLLAHACEEAATGSRNKGPLPTGIRAEFDGPPLRHIPNAQV